MSETDRLTLLECLGMALNWIDAVPNDTPLPAMPGFDRDAVNAVIEAHRRASQAAPAPVAGLVEDLHKASSPPIFATTSRKHTEGIFSDPDEFKVTPLYAAPAPSDGVREENERIIRKVAALIDPDAMKERGCDASSYTWEHHPLAQRVAISKARKVLGFLRAALSPAPAPSDGLQFLPMKWEDRGNKAGDIYCDTEVGQYVIGNIRGEIMVLRRFIDNGQMEDETVGYGDDHDDGRKVAQADYEARIVSCFAYPAAASPAQEGGK